jgi:hypothetical protein
VKEFERLTFAREILLRECKSSGANSKLPRLIDLCLGSPIATVPLAAKEIRVSRQAATVM